MDGHAAPSPHTVRAPGSNDAEAVLRLFAARHTKVLGFVELTLEETVERLAASGVDLTTDAWLAHGPDGEASGYSGVYRSHGPPELPIDVVAEDPRLGQWLLERVLSRARAIAGEEGFPEVAVDVGVYRDDVAQRALLAAAGFTTVTAYQQMRIDHLGPVAPPAFPDGVAVRSGVEGDAVRKAAHGVLESAFAGQFRAAPQSFEEWHAAREAQSSFDWSQLILIEVGGAPAAAREDNDHFAASQGCGYIQRLGVVESARGRGLGGLLLQDAFAAHASAGRVGTLLHVDVNNPTPALGAYVSAGMRPVLTIDAWRATVEAGLPAERSRLHR